MSRPQDINWDFTIRTRFYECDEVLTMEELYQAFKARLLEEQPSNNLENGAPGRLPNDN